MKLLILPMDSVAAREVATWRYPPPYDLYNISDPIEVADFLSHLDSGYYQIRSAAALVGYCCYGAEGRVPGGDYQAPAIDLGLGVRPDLIGHGQGRHYLDAVTGHAERWFDPPALRLTVASFNLRAIRLYGRAGFETVQRFSATFSGREFLVMLRKNGRA